MAKATKKRLKEIANHWIAEGWQKGNFQIVDELHAKNFIDRDPGGRASDREGFKQGIKELYDAFPDLFTKVEDLVVDAEIEKVAIRWTAIGKHAKTFMNFPPTGRSIRFKGIEIIRIENDLIVERWGEWDGIDLIEQLRAQT
ncbi:MAG: ester cyclase [Candidatus Aminicenantes bacterium]|jgi:steroid delta-isomerase-like uncharacterized protein